MKLFGKKYRSGKVAVKKIDKSCVAVIQPEGSTLKVHIILFTGGQRSQ